MTLSLSDTQLIPILKEDETESVTPEVLAALMLDGTPMTPDCLEDFWGYVQRQWGAQYSSVELRLDLPREQKTVYPTPWYDQRTQTLWVEGVQYHRSKTSAHFISGSGYVMTKGRFFGHMWGRGIMPKGWTN